MNELFDNTIERNGKVYHYDPERDIYYCRYKPMSTFDRCAWIVTMVVLVVVCLIIEYFK